MDVFIQFNLFVHVQHMLLLQEKGISAFAFYTYIRKVQHITDRTLMLRSKKVMRPYAMQCVRAAIYTYIYIIMHTSS